MTNKINVSEEKRLRRLEIAAKYQMTKNIRGYMMIALIIMVIASFFTWWGFSGFVDPILKDVAEQTRSIVAWIGIVVAILSLVVSCLMYFGYGNAKKHVLALIHLYNEQYPNSKYDGDKFGEKKSKK